MAKEIQPYREHWSREGFVGDGVNVTRNHHTPDFLSVRGPHAPHRLDIRDVSLVDRENPEALPQPVLAARSGTQLSQRGRRHVDEPVHVQVHHLHRERTGRRLEERVGKEVAGSVRE